MPKTALITGASSGIGAALARVHARKGGDLILVARRAEPMEALKAELVEAKARGLEVEILMNNAGFGGHGAFLDRDLAKDQAMIDLNISALVSLSHHFGQDMRARGKGRMLHVASTAGFIPGPFQAVYFATKAFVTSFSQALDQELRGHGITSTALCPGLVNTEFVDTAGLGDTGLANQKGATPASVARLGYEAMLRGALIALNEPQLGFMLNWVTPLLPRRAVLKMIAKMQSK